ncbi:hypothetical protein GCM10028801_08920 [Nocardioides maradonensis]
MEGRELLAAVRAASGLTQEALARRAGTSQATLSAYERGVKSPTLAVADRILHALGYELDAVPRITFTDHDLGVGDRIFFVPDRLWRLSPVEAFTSIPGMRRTRKKNGLMASRAERTGAYVALLEHGTPEELLAHLDGVLLVDVWPDIAPHLHDAIREAWTPLIWDTLNGGDDKLLIDGLRTVLGEEHRYVGRASRLRAVQRMVDLGVPYEAIAKVLADRREQLAGADQAPLDAYRRRRRIKAIERKIAEGRSSPPDP